MNTFRGFLVIAHVPGQNNMLLGQFMPQNNNQQTVQCDPTGANGMASIAHSNSARQDFQRMTFMWQAPTNADGMVNFRLALILVVKADICLKNTGCSGCIVP